MAKKSNVPELVGEVLKEIGETRQSAGWDCHGTFVLLHKALEKVAAVKNVRFDPPQVLSADVTAKEAVVLCVGHMGDKTEWSIGEAAPYNNKNNYPFAMAEKRAKDRVILKLVGLHGDVYSEDEAEAFQESAPENMPGTTIQGKGAPVEKPSKLDEAFTPAPDIDEQMSERTHDSPITKQLLDEFPGSKVESIKPNPKSLSIWASSVSKACAKASSQEHFDQVGEVIQNAYKNHSQVKGAPKMFGRLYEDHYMAAASKQSFNVKPLVSNDEVEI